MAEIDKSLPNVVDKLTPGELEVEQIAKSVEETPAGPTEVTENEDGSVDIDFDPKKAALGATQFDSNLAEVIDEQVLNTLGSELYQDIQSYKDSRADWEKAYTQGLDLLGFKYESRTEPFQGASSATHPVLAEAVTQFQALAYKELLPAEGPVRTQVIGLDTPEIQDQADRVAEFMNYQIMDIMKEYEPEFDQMLFYLPLSGSTFKKVYYDETLGRAVSKFIQAQDIIVPYTANSIDDAEAVVHVIKISENELRKQQVSGFYRDIELVASDELTQDDNIKSKERQLEGVTMSGQTEDVFTLLECHVNLDLEGFEDINPKDGEPTGIKLPYIITIEEGSREVLSIRRNYLQNDPLKKKVNYFVHFKFLPGFGFYGNGLIQMIGGLSRTATQALRQLLDAGTLANLPAGFKQRGIRIRDDAQPIQPGEFRDVDAPGGNIRDSFMQLPFKGPDQTLLSLMGICVQSAQRFASIADNQVGDMNQQAAVGTTVALLERGSRVMSAIHKRLYVGLKNEFKLLSEVFKTYLPQEYPYDVPGAQKNVKVSDFDDRIDVLPVADPNIFSQTQRISMAQSQLQLAQSNPQIHNLYQAYRSMYEALGVKNINNILPPPEQPMPMDPALEHILAISLKPFQAFPGQDHKAHIDAHLNFMSISMVQNNPGAMASLQKNILEHISLMAQEQVQIEFVRELQEVQQIQMMMQQAGAQSPAMMGGMQQNPQMMQAQQRLQQIVNAIEARKAILIAEMTKDYAEEEQKITGEFGADPLLKLKSRELDLRAKENERRKEYEEDRINLDKMKAMMNQQNQEDKLQQNEELASLRAGVSLAKSGLGNTQIKFDN